jgi:hypothetical protein
MQKELQGEKPLSRGRCRITKLDYELLDLFNNSDADRPKSYRENLAQARRHPQRSAVRG